MNPSHRTHNASVKYSTMHHFLTEMCTHVHISVTKWWIVGYGAGTFWGCVQQFNCEGSVYNLIFKTLITHFTMLCELIKRRPCHYCITISYVCHFLHTFSYVWKAWLRLRTYHCIIHSKCGIGFRLQLPGFTTSETHSTNNLWAHNPNPISKTTCYSHMTNNYHYSDAIMSAIASQITGVSIVYLTGCSGADHRKHQSSAPLAFVTEIHRWPVNSPRKEPVTRKMFPFDRLQFG